MSTMTLYQMYDLEAERCLGPILTEHKDGLAVRAFHEVLADKNTIPGKYPRQFCLIRIGKQDQDTGAIEPETPKAVANGSDWYRAVTKETGMVYPDAEVREHAD